MGYKTDYILDSDLPKLGWMVDVDLEKEMARCIHGKFVEVGRGWMVEGIWDGPFKEGNFHETDTFYGSGMRVMKDGLCFVTSSALTDRIFFYEDHGRCVFSNSLLMLLSFSGARLDEAHGYQDETLSIIRDGIYNYKKYFRVIHPGKKAFQQIFYENIFLKDGKVAYEMKQRNTAELVDYASLYQFLQDKIQKLKINFESPDRNVVINPFTTISGGYDSAAVSALVRKFGVGKCFTGGRLDGLLHKSKREKGKEIAEQLGYEIQLLDTRRSHISEEELYFLSSNYPKFARSVWSEISLHSIIKAIENQENSAVVFMGYGGDRVFDKNMAKQYQNGDFRGFGAISGLNLSEIRLKTGFFTAPILYLLSQKTKELLKISNSAEMRNWSIGTNYDRPIARRIVEEAGVDRHLFGMKKRHITTTYLWPINKKNRQRFFSYLKKEKRISRIYVIAFYLQKKIIGDMLKRNRFFGKDIDFYDMMRKWATALLVKRYSKLLLKYR